MARSSLDVIVYTTDGSTPNASSRVYLGPLTVTEFGTANAVVLNAACAPSPVGSSGFYGTNGSDEPLFLLVSVGPPNNDTTVTLAPMLTQGPQLAVCYTLDGSPPVCSATGTTAMCGPGVLSFSGAESITLDGTVTDPSTGEVTVLIDGCEALVSNAGPDGFYFAGAAETFLLAAAVPTATAPAPGPTAPGADPKFSTLTLPSAPPSVETIHLTLAPDPPPTCQTGAVIAGNTGIFSEAFVGATITATTTVSAIACKTGYAPSSVATFVYTVGSGGMDAGID